jgi:hypothetical protein
MGHPLRKPKIRSTVEVVTSDKHGGFKLALMNPETVLFAEDEVGNLMPWQPSLTKSQKYLWELYSRNVQAAIDIADGREMLALDLGDACHGVKYPQGLVSTRLSDQSVIAEYNTRPLFAYQKLKMYRQVIGTQAHNAGEGSLELILAELLQARHPRVDVKPLYHGNLNFAGVVTDCAHHGPHPGSRNWLRGNTARFYLRDLMQREIMDGKKPADLVLRGHYHTPVYEYLEMKNYFSELFILPSYSMLNDHAMQATQSQNELTHGMLVIEIEDGKVLRKHRLYETIDVRTQEVL